MSTFKGKTTTDRELERFFWLKSTIFNGQSLVEPGVISWYNLLVIIRQTLYLKIKARKLGVRWMEEYADGLVLSESEFWNLVLDEGK